MEIDPITGLPVLTKYQQETRARYIMRLREMADYFEARPNLPVPNHNVEIALWPDSKEEAAAFVRAAGPLKKAAGYSENTFQFRKDFDPQFAFRIVCEKQKTCERVLVEKKVIPAVEAHTIEIEAKPERIEEVYEWVCPESILRG